MIRTEALVPGLPDAALGLLMPAVAAGQPAQREIIPIFLRKFFCSLLSPQR